MGQRHVAQINISFFLKTILNINILQTTSWYFKNLKAMI